ncbi:MAG: hypothetical protein Ct9H300mP27_09000 [Chloroflexota bacterium]|nr:MAG: hypothetical protein Ct9H300mP27_09000 [Chloroflexota bacterium]
MSKLLDVLDKIKDGAPTPLGFSVKRPEKLPGMALIGLVSKDHAKGVGIVTDEGLDALNLGSSGDPKDIRALTDGLDGQPWGVRVAGLSRDDAQVYQENGSDALVFSIEGTSASALVNDELARFLCVDPNMDDKELRAVSSLPIDGFVMPLTQGNDGLTLGDLASVGSVSRRSDKYIVLEVEKPIEGKDLEALRDIGVHGLLVDIDLMGINNLKALKTALLEMPKPTFKRRDRPIAILPGSVFAPPEEPEPHEDEEEEGDE